MRQLTTWLGVIATAWLLWPSPALAQEETRPAKRQGPPMRITASARSHYQVPAGFRDGRGDLAVQGDELKVSGLFPVAPWTFVTAGLAAGHTRYHFDRANAVDPLEGEPAFQSYDGSLRLGINAPVSREWSVLLTGSIGFHVEEGVRPEEGLDGGGIGGVLYNFDREFALGVGVLARSRIKDDPLIIPIPLVRWRATFDEIWRVELGAPRGLRVGWMPWPEQLRFETGIGIRGFFSEDVRLDDDGFAPGGIMRVTTFPIHFAAVWSPFGPKHFSVTLDADFIAYQRVEIDDHRGRTLTDDRTAPTVRFALHLAWRF